MADNRIENRFISTVVLGECAKEAYGFMQDQWLQDLDAIQAWSIVKSHFAAYGTTISREEFREQFPGYSFVPEAASIESLMHNLQNRFVRTQLDDIMDEMEVDHEDPMASVSDLMSQLQSLRAQVDRGTGEDVAATANTALDRYAERRENKGAVGKEWPWYPLQASTLGAQDGMYTIFYARPKNMKSWLAVYLIVHWYVMYGTKILVVNRELSKAQFQDRLIAMLAGVPYSEFRKSQLTDAQYEMLEEAAGYMVENKNIIIESIYSCGAEAAAEVDALCEKYELKEGDILIIDGMYFYAGSSDWQLMREFSQGVQRATKRRGLVTVCTTQGNRNQGRQGADVGEELGLGDGPAQDCDMAVRVSLDEDSQELTLSIRAIREGRLCSFVINAILCEDFSVKYTNDYFGEEDKSSPPPGRTRDAKRQSKAGTAKAPTANVARIGERKKKGKGIRPGKRKGRVPGKRAV